MITKYWRLFRLISLYHLRHYPLRTAISVLVMAVGVTCVFWTVLALANRDRMFSNGVSILSGSADLEIRTEESELTAAHLAAIRQLPGVTTAAPLVMGGGVIIGQGDLMLFWGIDPTVEQQAREYKIAQGNFVSKSGEILLTESYAAEKGYRAGQTLWLAGPGGVRSLIIAGLLADEGLAAFNGGDILVLDMQDNLALQRRSAFDAISVQVAEGQPVDVIAQAITAVLPADSQVLAPTSYYQETLAGRVSQALVIFTGTMPGAVGALIIFNTLAAFVAQRRKETGTLRALGLTRDDILSLYLVESLFFGVVASLLGLGLGYVLPVVPVYESTEVGPLRAVMALETPAWAYPATFIIGIFMVLLAGLLPARRAASLDPLEAIVRPRMDTGSAQPAPLRLALGLGILIGIFVLRQAVNHSANAVLMPVVGSLGVLIGSLLVFPTLMIILSRRLAPLGQRLFGPSGKLAADSLVKRPRRIVSTGIMVLLVVQFAAMGFGMELGSSRFITALLETENGWDITVAGPGTDPDNPIAPIPAEVVAAIAARPAVAAVVQETYASVTYNQHPYTIRAVDMAAFQANGGQILLGAGDPGVVYSRLQAGEHPAVLAAGFNALADGLQQVGHTLTLDTPTGPVTFEVVGTFHVPAAASIAASDTLIMDRTLYQRFWQDEAVDRLLIRLQPDANAQEERRALLQAYALQGLAVVDRITVEKSFRRPSAGAGVSTASLVPLMILGIANTLFIAVLDRQREIGILRAVGTLRRQLLFSLLLEVAFLIILACLWGIPMGFYTIKMMLFEDLTGVVIWPDAASIGITLALMLTAGVAAALIPAWRAGRTDILEALHYE